MKIRFSSTNTRYKIYNVTGSNSFLMSFGVKIHFLIFLKDELKFFEGKTRSLHEKVFKTEERF